MPDVEANWITIGKGMCCLYIYLCVSMYGTEYYSALTNKAIPAMCDISLPYGITLNGISESWINSLRFDLDISNSHSP